MTFDRQIVGFRIENLEIWSISYEIVHFADTPSYLNSIDFPRGNFDAACSFRWGSTSFFTPPLSTYCLIILIVPSINSLIEFN